jgi:hypothetical protein
LRLSPNPFDTSNNSVFDQRQRSCVGGEQGAFDVRVEVVPAGGGPGYA